MSFLKFFFIDAYSDKIIKYDIYYKFNLYKTFVIFSLFKFLYMNYYKYSLYILARIYRILRDNYNSLNTNILINTKHYLKGRILYDNILIYGYLVQKDSFYSLNYLFFYTFRLHLKYKGLFLISSGLNEEENESILLDDGENEIRKGVTVYWNEFFSRLVQIKRAVLKDERELSFFNVELYRLTLNLYLYSNVDEEYRTKFLVIYLSFFGFFSLLLSRKYYQFYIRVI